MNSCVLSGLIGEAEDRHGHNKEEAQVVPECNGPATELTEPAVSARHITKCHSSGSEKLYQSICGQNYCNTKFY
jgi:hypothetical protein